MPSHHSLTIVMPTFNRIEWLEVGVKYLISQNLGYKLIILDGSSENNKILNQNLLQSLAHKNIEYRPYSSDLHLGLRMYEGIKLVETEYVLIWPDDDFVVIEDLPSMLSFLDLHPDYSAVLGKVLCLDKSQFVHRLMPSKSYFLINHLRYSPDLKDSRVLRRILSYYLLTRMGAMPLFYSIRRTSQLKESFKHITPNTTYAAMEFILNTQCLIDGKVKSFESLFGFRNYSNEPTRCDMREGQTSYFSSEDIMHSKVVLKNKLIESGTSEEIADYFFEEIIDSPYDPAKYTYGSGVTLRQLYPFLKLYKLVQLLAYMFELPWIEKVYNLESKPFKKLKEFLP